MIVRQPPRLWVLLLVCNLTVLALPVTALWAMRLYESALVRQTEVELIAQAAVWAAAFRQELRHGAPDAAPAPIPMDSANAGLSATAVSLLRRPGLDLADDPVLPPLPDPQPASQPAEPLAAAVGRALTPMIGDAQAVTLAALRLTDSRGVVVAASTASDVGRSLAGWDEVAKVLAGAPIATSMRQRDAVDAPLNSISRTARLRVFVALPIPGSAGPAGVVVLSRTPRTVGQAIWGKRWAVIGLGAGLLIAGVLFAVGLSALVTRPIGVVVTQAQRAALGSEVAPLRHPGTREVADLSAALTRMATTLDQRSRYIVAFATSVSHEFKTPLAGLRGAAELLEDHAETLSSDERSRLLTVVSTSTQRLNVLVGRLLELARADMMRPGVATASTSVATVLDGLLRAYRARGMNITVSGDDVRVALSPDALAALLASLLDNAAVHASTDGSGSGANVSIQLSVRADCVQIVVSDQGPGMSPANRARVFDPFFTTTREKGGTGLGLAIVRAIAVGAGGTAALVDSDFGACFRIELPGSRVPDPSDR